MKTQAYRPTGYQLDPNTLDTEKVQLWVNGIMVAMITLAEAREMVQNQNAFAISCQAIGALDAKGYSAA